MSREYCRRLTKEELIAGGVSNITKSGRVYKNGKRIRITPNGNYRMFSIYELDENGNKIKVPRIMYSRYTGQPYETYTYKMRLVPLHRAMYAWFRGEAAEGKVIDHIENDKNKKLIKNNLIDCLQEITQGENLAKDRKHVRQANPNHKGWPSREFIVDKLNYFKALHDAADDAETKHKYRGSIGNWRANLRLFDSDPERYTRKPKVKQVNKCHERAEAIRKAKAAIDAARIVYNEARTAENRASWKLAIENWKQLVNNK